MRSSETRLYNPPTVKRLLRGVASALEKFLPARWYAAVYGHAFRLYRAVLRSMYWSRVVVARLRRQPAGLVRAATIIEVMPHSLVGAAGLEATYDVILATEEGGVEGCLVECGVAEGGSAALMGLVSRRFRKRRDLWLFDSYAGLPSPTDEDFVEDATGLHIRPLPEGSCLGQREAVENLLFGRFGLDRGHVHLVAGWFEDTVPEYSGLVGQIAVLRVDADWYKSVKCCLDNLFDSVAEKGYVIVDDYATCFGAKRAVDEFLGERGLAVEMVHDGRGGCHFRKGGRGG